MRLPAVVIAVAFAAGIALGLCPPLATLQASPHFFQLTFALSAASIAFGILLLRRSPPIAATASLAAWLLLGITGAAIAHQPPPSNHVLRMVDSGAIDLHTPLRWQGTLRDDPTDLPWGTALDITLSSVEFQQTTIPLSGGLRITYSPHVAQAILPAHSAAISSAHSVAQLPDLHAGDAISVVTQARLPQFFRDEGAFDRRSYLRQ